MFLLRLVPEVQELGLYSPTVRPVLTFPGLVRPTPLKRLTMSLSQSRPTSKTDRLDGLEYCI